MNIPNSNQGPPGVLWLLLAVAALAVLVAAAGCTSTVAPKLTPAKQGSFDRVPARAGGVTNYQTSGALGFTNHELIITPTAKARYEALAVKYGGQFTPPLTTNDGPTVLPGQGNGSTSGDTNLYLMPKDMLDKFAQMTEWQRNGVPAKPKTFGAPSSAPP